MTGGESEQPIRQRPLGTLMLHTLSSVAFAIAGINAYNHGISSQTYLIAALGVMWLLSGEIVMRWL